MKFTRTKPRIKVRTVKLPPVHKKIFLVDLRYETARTDLSLRFQGIRILIEEYMADLGYRKPKHMDVRSWYDYPIHNIKLDPPPYTEEGQMRDFLTMRRLSTRRKGLVFILFGYRAERMRKHIDESKHLVILVKHPCAYNNHRDKHLPPIKGSRLFSRACAYAELPKDIWRLV